METFLKSRSPLLLAAAALLAAVPGPAASAKASMPPGINSPTVVGKSPWNGRTNQAITGFASSNIFLGNNARTRPEVLIVKINGVSFERSLVCTRVRGSWGFQREGQQEVLNYQEHITEHFFGVLTFIDAIPFPISEM
ncbi:MAG: hypothetical protein NZM43_13590 [Saprospiraceae bacterium]|nr:hypothetical protein [Saprospiraceae bacterium]MDW8485347.1 hypothetical protein [Saprospiraceae bacterium]